MCLKNSFLTEGRREQELEVAFFLQFSWLRVFSIYLVMFASGVGLNRSKEQSLSFTNSGLTVAGLYVARTTALQGFLIFSVSQKDCCF